MSKLYSLSMKVMRSIALGAVRGTLHTQHVNPLEVSASEAHKVLDDIARSSPDLIASLWYRRASTLQLSLFYREWEQWRKETQRLLSHS